MSKTPEGGLEEQKNIEKDDEALATTSTPKPEAEQPYVPEETNAPIATPDRPRAHKLKSLLKNKKFYIPALVVLFVLILVVGLTDLKYSLLGVVVKRNVTIEVVDEKTLQAVSGVTVELAGKKATTDGKGQAKFKGISTGRSSVALTRSGYKAKKQDVLIRFTSTKLDPIRLTGTGYALSFKVKDKISGQPIKEAKLVLGGAEALTNTKGEAVVRVLPSGPAKLSLSVSKQGFNSAVQDVEVKDNAPLQELTLTPAGTALFISNRQHKYNVYAADLDGKNERLVLSATGKEDKDTKIVPSPTGEYVALIASREGRSEYGSTLREIYVINVATGELKKVDDENGSVDWSGNTLMYQAVDADLSVVLRSYNAATKAKKTLVKSAGAYIIVQDKIYYSLGNPEEPEYGTYVMNADGTGKKRIDKRAYAVSRPAVEYLGLADYSDNTFSKLNLKTGAIEKLDTEPKAEESLSKFINYGETYVYTKNVDSFNQLFSAKADGSGQKQLTKGAHVSDSFYVTPNGAYIVFYGAIGTDAGVYILPIEGGISTKIANGYVK